MMFTSTFLNLIISLYRKIKKEREEEKRRPLAHIAEVPITGVQLEREVAQRIKNLEKRMQSIENHLQFSKMSSINDATLVVVLEEYSRRIDNLEKSMLTPWDIVKVVFKIVGFAAAIAAIMRLL